MLMPASSDAKKDREVASIATKPWLPRDALRMVRIDASRSDAALSLVSQAMVGKSLEHRGLATRVFGLACALHRRSDR